MLIYTWNLDHNVEQCKTTLLDLPDTASCHGKFITKQFLSFLFLLYIEPLTKEVEFNRGTVHYVRHFALCLGRIKETEGATVINGLAFFDILERLFFVALVFFGVGFVSESFLMGGVLAVFIYFLLLFISFDRDKDTIAWLGATLRR